MVRKMNALQDIHDWIEWNGVSAHNVTVARWPPTSSCVRAWVSY